MGTKTGTPKVTVLVPPKNAPPGGGIADLPSDVDVKALETEKPRKVFNLAFEDLNDIRDECVEILLADNYPPTLFSRADSIAVVRAAKIQPWIGGIADNRLYDMASWQTGKAGTRSNPPPRLERMLHMLLPFVESLPELEAITGVPTFSAEGVFETRAGYHEGTREFYVPAPGLVIPDVSDNPTSAERAKAKSLILDDVLPNFPFVNDYSKANAVAMLLLGFIRPMLGGGDAPMFVIDAPMPGTGKGRLANALSRIITGKDLPVTPEAESEAEWRKKVFAILLEGRPIISFDNLGLRLSSQTLCSLLTGGGLLDRILGFSKVQFVKCQSILIGTGNNVTASGEIIRRTVRTRIAWPDGSPLGRKNFKHPDLLQWVSRNRGDLIWAVATLVKAWLADGAKRSDFRKDSFENWSAITGGILATAGIPGLDVADPEWTEEVKDSTAEVLARFVRIWWSKWQNKPINAGQLMPTALDAELELDVRSDEPMKARRALTAYLRKNQDVFAGGCYIRETDLKTDGVVWWKLEQRGVKA